METMSNQIHSRRTANGITMFRGAVMAGLLASTLVTALPSITFADGGGDKGKHSLVQQPYGLKTKSPFAAIFATQDAIAGLEQKMIALDAKVTFLTTENTKLNQANAALQVALDAAKADVSMVSGKVVALETKAADIIPGLAKYLKVDTTNVLNGVIGPHILFSGVNVHVRNGSGATDNNNAPYQGLGNLVVGYNEDPNAILASARKGSHNVVGGSVNSFGSYGGMVFGYQNKINGPYATVLSGSGNNAQGTNSTVLGMSGKNAVNLNSIVPELGGSTPPPPGK